MKKKLDYQTRIDRARSFDALLQIAIGKIQNLRRHHGRHCIVWMICGPLFTGPGDRPNDTSEKKEKRNAKRLCQFEAVIAQLRRERRVVFDQLPFRDVLRHLEKDGKGLVIYDFFEKLFQTADCMNQLCFLQGWKKSCGAALEHELAERWRVPFVTFSRRFSVKEKRHDEI